VTIRRVTLAVAAVLVLGACTSARGARGACPAPKSVTILSTQNIQAVVDAYPEGTTFALGAGTFREQTVHPKNGDTFTGQAGTILSGARVLTGWQQSGSTWWVGGQTQNQGLYGECQAAHPMCGQSEELFVDGVRLEPVSQASGVAPGRWYFDHGANRIVIGDNPSGRLLETSVTTRAFGGLANNVTITGMTIEHYATPNQNGVIQAGPRPGGIPDGGTGWLLQDLVIRRNHGVGVAMGNTTTVRRVHANENGNLGIVGTSASGGLVEDTEIAGNNTSGVESGWSAGGAKWAGDYNDLTVENTTARDNDGPGLWVDESCARARFIGNAVLDNTTAGIAVEISYGALVSGNTVRGNGLAVPPGWLWGSGIQIADSPDVEVVGNTVTGNRNAIAGVQQSRGSGTLGPHLLRNLNVHGNTIGLGVGGAGVATDTGDPEVFAGSNRFVGNTWTLGSDPYPYAWGNRWNTPAQWTATGNS
jgi:parallel beta-helix repeat protein